MVFNFRMNYNRFQINFFNIPDVLRNNLIWIVDRWCNHGTSWWMSLNQSRNGLDPCHICCSMTSCELVGQTAILASIWLQFLRIWNWNLSIPVSTADYNLASIHYKNWLIQRSHCEIILQQNWTECILVELLLLFATGKRCEWVQIICLVYPHVKS